MLLPIPIIIAFCTAYEFVLLIIMVVVSGSSKDYLKMNFHDFLLSNRSLNSGGLE